MRQYLPITEPLVPHPPNDAVAVDSWAHAMPDVVRRVSTVACLASAIFIAAPVFVPDVTQPVTRLSWRGTAYPDRIERKRPERDYHGSFIAPVFVPDVTTDDPTKYGHAVFPEWIARKRAAFTYREYFTTAIFVPDLTNPVTRLSWQGTAYPERVARKTLPRAAQQVSAFNPDPIPPPPVVAAGQSIAVGSYDLWQYQAEFGPFMPNVATDTIPWETIQQQALPPTRAVGRHGALGAHVVSILFVPDLTNPVPARSWAGVYPDRIDKKRAVAWQQTWTADRFIYTFADPEFLDWTPRYPEVLPRPQRARGVEPPTHFVVPAPTQSTPGGGGIATGATLLWQYQMLAGPLEVPSIAPPDTTIGWQTYIPAQLLVPRRTPIYQVWAMDRFDPPTVVPPPTEETWQGRYPSAVRGRLPIHHRVPSFFADAKFIPTVPLEDRFGWRGVYADRVNRLTPRYQHVWAQPHFVIEVPVPVMSWTGLYLDPPVRRRSSRAVLHQQQPWPSQIADVTTPIIESSWDNWYPDLVHGRRPLNREQVLVEPIYLADITVIAPTLSWRAIYPDRIHPKRRLAEYKPWTMDATWTAPVAATAPALAVPVFVDRTGRRIPVVPHPDLGWPPHVLDVTNPVTPLSWLPRAPDVIFAVRRAPQLHDNVTKDPFPHPPVTFLAAWALGSNRYLTHPIDLVEDHQGEDS